MLLLKPTANALFLSILGIDFLPVAYLVVALAALAISLFYNRYIESKAPRQLFAITSYISVLILGLVGTLLFLGIAENIVVFIFYLFVSVFGILSASQFWIISNQIFNARQARKYFSVIGSGAIAGGIAGGYLASMISAVFQSELILFVAAAVILYAVFQTSRLPVIAQGTAYRKSRKYRQATLLKILKPFYLIRETRHLRLITLLVAASVFVAKLIDYQFGYFATRAYPVEEELTSFYGFWFSSFNVISLLIQLVLTNKIVGRFGVAYSILILPALLLLGSVAILIFPVLLIALLLKLSDSSLKQSINKASFELIMLPIPDDLKLRTKTFIDVFIDSLATGICGLLILFFINAINLPNLFVSLLMAAGVLFWLYCANKLRQEYKQVFRQSLKLRSDQSRISDKQLLQQYEDLLRNGTDTQKLKTLNLLKNSELSLDEDLIRELLKDSNHHIAIACIHLILFDSKDFTREVRELLNHEKQSLRAAAFEYLINHQESLESHFLLKYLESQDINQCITALTAYTKEFGNNPVIVKVLDLEKRVRELLTGVKQNPEQFSSYHHVALLKCIAYGRFREHYHFLREKLNSEESFIRNHAIQAAAESGEKEFFESLTQMLFTAEFPNAVLSDALSRFGFEKIDDLSKKLILSESNDDLERLIPVFGKIASQDAVYRLESLLDHEELDIRNQAIQALSDLNKNHPLLKINNKLLYSHLIREADYNNSILIFLIKNAGKQADNTRLDALIEVLKSKIDYNLSIIFKLLNIIYPPENYLELFNYVKDPDYTLRSNAIEYLDNALQPSLKSIIVPLIEYKFNDTHPQIEAGKPEMEEIEKNLLQSRDTEIRSAAYAYFKY